MDPAAFSKTYPPRNRTSTDDLSPIDTEVVSGTGAQVLNPTQMMMLALGATLPFGEPLDDVSSVISGAPAYRLRMPGIELALTPGELHRLLRRELTPQEFTALRDRYGIFHDIAADFYDEDTGKALQPMSARR
jgi:hypothetical protein